jgi:hypothetical protein
MASLNRIEFPVVGSVEVRTFAAANNPAKHHYRCVKAVFRKKAAPTGVNQLVFRVDDGFLLLDVERGGQLIPHVTAFEINSGGGGVLLGRLRRLTDDHVEAEAPDFSRGGYLFARRLGDPVRLVSEEFMLMDVELDRDAFDEAEKQALRKYQDDQGRMSAATAWGAGRPAPDPTKE